jgi:anti-sigma factor RsiW
MTLISDRDLHAYLDGELDDEDNSRVAAAIAASPDLARRVALLAGDKDLIGRVYGPLADRPLPDSLTALLAPPASARRPLPWWQPGLAAAAAVLLAAGLFLAPTPRGVVAPSEAVIAEAVAARAGRMLAAGTVAGDAAARDAALAGALGLPLKVPDLAKAGFALVEVTLFDPGGGRRALQLRYGDRRGRVFTVFLHPSAGDDRFEMRQQGGLRVCLWQNSDLTAVMLAEMPAAEMLRVASLTYADLNF